MISIISSITKVVLRTLEVVETECYGSDVIANNTGPECKGSFVLHREKDSVKFRAVDPNKACTSTDIQS